MKKIITLLLFIVATNNTYSQQINSKKTIKTKSDTKKEIVTETVTIDKNKPKIDSVKLKEVTTTEIIEVIDTVVVPAGKFKPFKKNAHASYYAARFTGKRSASGRVFDNNKYFAAHKKFPFGTKLKVTNEANNKSVYVEVIDRGPFVKGRELDLSRRAFMEIASNRGAGAVIVSIEVLQK